jgi:hypothetical protein
MDYSDDDCERQGETSESQCSRSTWLLNVSLALAVLLQCAPVEADIASSVIHLGGDTRTIIVRLLCVKVCVVVAIFLPLMIHLWRNGWQVKRTIISIQGLLIASCIGLGMILTGYLIWRCLTHV